MRPQDVVERALAASRVDGCVVVVEEGGEANLRWANNTLTTNGVARGRTVTVVSVHGESVGVATREGPAAGDVEALVAASEAAARQAPPAEDAAPLLGAEESLGDWEGEPAGTSTSVFERFAPGLAESFVRARGSGQLLFGFAYHRMVTTYLGTSSGLRSRHDQPTGHVELNGKSADMARSTWVGVATADFSDVDVGALHDETEVRLGWAERTAELPAGRYETVLPPSAVADMMIYLYWSAEARDAHEGRSVFSRPGGGTRVGEILSPHPLTLRSDPAAAGLASAPFLTAHVSGSGRSVFDNGTPLGPTEWISSGTLASLVQTRHSASLTGLGFTPYVDNLLLDTSEPSGSLADLVGGTRRGLLLTCLWYIREVDPRSLLLTGLTRDGVYLVEGGEVTAAVNNFRFNESPVSLLGRVRAAGRSERTLPREWCDYFTRTSMPPLAVGDFNMSTVSEAS